MAQTAARQDRASNDLKDPADFPNHPHAKLNDEPAQREGEVQRAFSALRARSAILDGELCFTDQSGTPDFRALHRAMHVSQPDQERLIVYAFDLMHRNGADLRGKPLHERRRRLLEIAEPGRVPCLFIGDQYADGVALLKQCERFRLEGVVSKRRDSTYVSGETKAWIKSKCRSWKDRNRERWRMFEGGNGEDREAREVVE